MKILGIRYGHDASAALIVDGKIVADVAEERFSRIKNDASFPINSILYCLKEGNINSDMLDCLAIPTSSFQRDFRSFFSIPADIVPRRMGRASKIRSRISGFVRRNNLRDDPYTSTNKTVLPLYQTPLKLSDRCKILLIEHHLAHASSACYTSGLIDEKALVVTMDGRGDDVSVAIWRFNNNKISKLKSFDGRGSVGWFYACATEAMGWRQSSDEWKVMGLAPYGVPKPGVLKGFYPEYKDGYLVTPHDYGEFGRWNDHGANHYHSKDSIELRKIVNKIGRKDFAAEVQRISEEQAMNIILPWLAKEKTKHLLCAGGCFLNVKLNQKVWYSGEVDTQWVYPNCGDSGLSVGAALLAHHTNCDCDNERHNVLTSLYHGPGFSDEEIKLILDDRGLDYKFVENPSEEAADYLIKNNIVGWFRGRMESGPRALGNRSIIMSPLRAENKDIINKKVKFREAFRPFTPSLLYEKAGDYFVNIREEKYMVCSFAVRAEKRSKIPAVVHIDGTARPQMVKREYNRFFYDLIKSFGDRTGEYVVLNTSFNIKGEPIVLHPREALRCFYDTGIDVLFLNNFVIEKPAVKKKLNYLS